MSDDATIEKMLDAFYDAGGEDSDNMAAALSVARKATLEAAATRIDAHERKLSSYLDRGKGLHGTPGYVTDDNWSCWLGQREICEVLAREFRSLDNHEQPQ